MMISIKQKMIKPADYLSKLKDQPTRIAVKWQHGNENLSLTCQALYEKIKNRVAYFNEKLEIKKGDVVAVLAPRGPEYLISVLALWQIGAVFLPLSEAWKDKGALASRLNATLIKYLLISKMLANEKKSELEKWQGTKILFETIEEYTPGKEINLDEMPELAASDPAYIYSSSGTTGAPKLIQLPHAGILERIEDHITYMDIKEEEGVLVFMDFGFDASLAEMLLAVCSGNTLFILPGESRENYSELLTFFKKYPEEIKIALLVPSILSDLKAEDYKSIRKIITVGEACMMETLKNNGWFDQAEIYNGYGPTETTFGATLTKLEKDTDPSIFRHMKGVRLYLREFFKLHFTGDKEEIPSQRNREKWVFYLKKGTMQVEQKESHWFYCMETLKGAIHENKKITEENVNGWCDNITNGSESADEDEKKLLAWLIENTVKTKETISEKDWGTSFLQGELLIQTTGMGRYLNISEKNKEKFIEIDDGEPVFCSGDVVSVENEKMRYLFRIDNQIKRYGQLITLEAVESAFKIENEVLKKYVKNVAAVYHKGVLFAFIEPTEVVFTDKEKHILFSKAVNRAVYEEGIIEPKLRPNVCYWVGKLPTTQQRQKLSRDINDYQQIVQDQKQKKEKQKKEKVTEIQRFQFHQPEKLCDNKLIELSKIWRTLLEGEDILQLEDDFCYPLDYSFNLLGGDSLLTARMIHLVWESHSKTKTPAPNIFSQAIIYDMTLGGISFYLKYHKEKLFEKNDSANEGMPVFLFTSDILEAYASCPVYQWRGNKELGEAIKLCESKDWEKGNNQTKRYLVLLKSKCEELRDKHDGHLPFCLVADKDYLPFAEKLAKEFERLDGTVYLFKYEGEKSLEDLPGWKERQNKRLENFLSKKLERKVGFFISDAPQSHFESNYYFALPQMSSPTTAEFSQAYSNVTWLIGEPQSGKTSALKQMIQQKKCGAELILILQVAGLSSENIVESALCQLLPQWQWDSLKDKHLTFVVDDYDTIARQDCVPLWEQAEKLGFKKIQWFISCDALYWDTYGEHLKKNSSKKVFFSNQKFELHYPEVEPQQKYEFIKNWFLKCYARWRPPISKDAYLETAFNTLSQALCLSKESLFLMEGSHWESGDYLKKQLPTPSWQAYAAIYPVRYLLRFPGWNWNSEARQFKEKFQFEKETLQSSAQNLTQKEQGELSQIAPGDFFKQFVNFSTEENAQYRILPLKIVPKTKPVFLFHPLTGETPVYYRELRDAVFRQTVYALQMAPRDEEVDSEKKAELYYQYITTIQKDGSYCLMGWSYGGALAYQVAHLLEAKDKKVEAVFIIDSPPPSYIDTISRGNRAIDMVRVLVKDIYKINNFDDIQFEKEIEPKEKLEQAREIDWYFDEAIVRLQKMSHEKKSACISALKKAKINLTAYYGFKEWSEQIREGNLKKLNACVYLFEAENKKPCLFNGEEFGEEWKKYANDVIHKKLQGNHFEIFSIHLYDELKKSFPAVKPLKNRLKEYRRGALKELIQKEISQKPISILLRASRFSHQRSDFKQHPPVKKALDEFLKKPAAEAPCFLLQGDPGSGKSVYLEKLYRECLTKHSHYFPILIKLKPGIENRLKQALFSVGITETEYENLSRNASEEKTKEFFGQPLLVLFDGYDEALTTENLYLSEENMLQRLGAKMVLTCRSYAVKEEKLAAQFGDGVQKPHTRYLQPFTESDINDYLKKYNELHKNDLSKTELEIDTYHKTPDPFLLHNPQLLSIAVQFWDEVPSLQNRAAFYQKLFTHRANDNEKKVQSSEGVRLNVNLLEAFKHYNQRLAFQYWRFMASGKPEDLLIVEPDNLDSKQAQLGQVINTLPGAELKHITFWEYQLAEALVHAIVTNDDEQLGAGNLKENLSLLYMLRDCLRLRDKKEFLEIQEKLFDFVFASRIFEKRDERKITTAAANALSILVALKVPLSNLDLSNICVPGAFLYGALLENTQFKNANLRGACLENAYLVGTDFSSADCRDIDFGVIDAKTFDAELVTLKWSLDGNYAAIQTTDTLSLWSIPSGLLKEALLLKQWPVTQLHGFVFTQTLLVILEVDTERDEDNIILTTCQIKTGEKQAVCKFSDKIQDKKGLALVSSSDGLWFGLKYPTGFHLWEANSGYPERKTIPVSTEMLIKAMALSGEYHGDRFLALWSFDNTIKIYALSSGTLVQKIHVQYHLPMYENYDTALAFNSSGALRLLTRQGKQFRVWASDDKCEKYEKDAIISSETEAIMPFFSEDGKTIFWLNTQHLLEGFDLETKRVTTAVLPTETRQTLIILHPNGSLWISAGNTLRVLDPQTLNRTFSLLENPKRPEIIVGYIGQTLLLSELWMEVPLTYRHRRISCWSKEPLLLLDRQTHARQCLGLPHGKLRQYQWYADLHLLVEIHEESIKRKTRFKTEFVHIDGEQVALLRITVSSGFSARRQQSRRTHPPICFLERGERFACLNADGALITLYNTQDVLENPDNPIFQTPIPRDENSFLDRMFYLRNDRLLFGEETSLSPRKMFSAKSYNLQLWDTEKSERIAVLLQHPALPHTEENPWVIIALNETKKILQIDWKQKEGNHLRHHHSLFELEKGTFLQRGNLNTRPGQRWQYLDPMPLFQQKSLSAPNGNKHKKNQESCLLFRVAETEQLIIENIVFDEVTKTNSSLLKSVAKCRLPEQDHSTVRKPFESVRLCFQETSPRRLTYFLSTNYLLARAIDALIEQAWLARLAQNPVSIAVINQEKLSHKVAVRLCRFLATHQILKFDEQKEMVALHPGLGMALAKFSKMEGPTINQESQDCKITLQNNTLIFEGEALPTLCALYRLGQSVRYLHEAAFYYCFDEPKQAIFQDVFGLETENAIAYLIQFHFLESTKKKEIYALTPLSEVLTAYHPETIQPTLAMLMEDWWSAVNELFRSKEVAFQWCTGQAFFDYLSEHPTMEKQFNEGLACLKQTEHPAIIETLQTYPALDFNVYDSIVDIAGGSGAFLEKIRQLYPQKTLTLYERPTTISDVRRSSKTNEEEAIQLVEGNFLKPTPKHNIPKSAELYLIKGVLQDFDESACITILKHVHDHMDEGAKLYLIERTLPEAKTPHVNGYGDLMMLMLLGGQVRTVKDWQRLLLQAHFFWLNANEPLFVDDHAIMICVPSAELSPRNNSQWLSIKKEKPLFPRTQTFSLDSKASQKWLKRLAELNRPIFGAGELQIRTNTNAMRLNVAYDEKIIPFINVLLEKQQVESLSLTEFNFSKVKFNSELLIKLKESTRLSSLILQQGILGPAGIFALREILTAKTHIEQLALVDVEWAMAIWLKAINPETLTLTGLRLCNDKPTDQSIALELGQWLGKMTRLYELNLTNMQIGENSAKALFTALTSLTTLTALNVSHNKIGSQGCHALAKLIGKNPFLTSLDVSYNNLTERDFILLVNALKIHPALSELKIDHNPLQKGTQSLFSILKENPSLIYIDATDTFLLEKPSPSWMGILLRNKTLLNFKMIEQSKETKSQGDLSLLDLQQYANKRTLANLQARMCRAHETILAAYCYSIPEPIVIKILKIVWLGRTKKEIKEHLGHLKKYDRSYQLNYTLRFDISETYSLAYEQYIIALLQKGAKLWCPSKILWDIAQSQVPQTMNELKSNLDTWLQNLGLSRFVKEEKFARCEVLFGLVLLTEAFYLRYQQQVLQKANPRAVEEMRMHYFGMQFLKKLCLQQVITEQEQETIQKFQIVPSKNNWCALFILLCRELQLLPKRHNRYQSILLLLEKQELLPLHSEISISLLSSVQSKKLTTENALRQDEAHGTLTCSVAKLEVDDEEKVSQFITPIIAGNMLKTLHLCGRLNGLNCPPILTTALIDALKLTTSLQNLYLEKIPFCSQQENIGVRAVEVVSNHRSITELHLHDNAYQDEIFNLALSGLLKTNTKLTTLNLANNNFHESDFAVIFNGLKENKTLTALELYSNMVGEQNGVELMKIIKTHPTLTSLNLANTAIGDKTIKALIEVIKMNKCLKIINCSLNKISNGSVKKFLCALQENKVIVEITLPENSLKNSQQKELKKLLEKNQQQATKKQSNTPQQKTIIPSLDDGYGTFFRCQREPSSEIINIMKNPEGNQSSYDSVLMLSNTINSSNSASIQFSEKPRISGIMENIGFLKLNKEPVTQIHIEKDRQMQKNIAIELIGKHKENIELQKMLAPAIEEAKLTSKIFNKIIIEHELKGAELIQAYLKHYVADPENKLHPAFYLAIEHVKRLELQSSHKFSNIK